MFPVNFVTDVPGCTKGSIALGPQPETFEGARVFVLPNPSGRNANFTYAEMLKAFVELRNLLEARISGPLPARRE